MLPNLMKISQLIIQSQDHMNWSVRDSTTEITHRIKELDEKENKLV
jgi:hypothetical protein